MKWQTSSHSAQGNCVAVKKAADGVFVRDSKEPLRITDFGRDAWAAFLGWLR